MKTLREYIDLIKEVDNETEDEEKEDIEENDGSDTISKLDDALNDLSSSKTVHRY